MPNPIIKFFKGSKGELNKAPKQEGAIYVATGGTNAHLYYAESNTQITNIAPSFIESQTNKEIVITFDE